MKRHIDRTRLALMLGGMVLVFGAIGWRLFDIAYSRHAWYAQVAQSQATGSTVLLRGSIYLSGGDQEFLAAVNRKFPALMIVPNVLDPAQMSDTVDRLSAITGAAREGIAKVAMSGSSGSRAVVHHLSDEQVTLIRALGRAGVTIGYETDRFYPASTLAADVIGFLGYDQEGRHGQYGVESSYERELSGRKAIAGAQWNPFSQLKALLGIADEAVDPTEDTPHDLVLTIDKNIQAYVEHALDATLKKYSASSGLVIVQDPTTGRILAMADSPTFDPNTYATASTVSFLNAGVQTPFEPGSSFKPFTMAMGLDLGKITPNTTYDDVNDIVVDGYTIKNFNEGHFGRVTMTKVLEKSINAGTIYVQSLISNDQFLNYMVNLGFGQKTGVDLPGEASGDIGNLYTGRRINFMTTSFGQGVTVTPMQLINGYSAIANGGKLMRPYVVAKVRDQRGMAILTKPEVIGTPFLSRTAATLRQMLVSVVDNGFDKARIPRYDVAGKTGTAQIADPVNGGYLEGQYNHSFVGFAPASDPKFTILIKIERPQGVTFAADSLSPVFKDIALFLLNYLNVPPTR